MIFVTVGTQLPFDRLIRTIDQWASARPYADAFAQIGPAEYRPSNIPWAEFLDSDECRRKTEQADVVVAHAGMGSILTALELGRPILVMPRLAALGEQRNDHQLATAKKLLSQGRIFVAFDENQLLEKLDYLNKLKPTERISVHASSTLLTTLQAFVAGKKVELPTVVSMTQTVAREIPAANKNVEHIPSNGAGWQAGLREKSGNGFPGHGHPTTSDLLSGFRGGERNSSFNTNQVDSAPHRAEPSTSQEIKSGLCCVILLAGRLRPTDLEKQIKRSQLDLPVDGHQSILSYWQAEVAQLAEGWGRKSLTIRVLQNQAALMPTLPPPVPGITLSVERDQFEFRGTGGVLRDACADYSDNAWVLVANASQMLFQPLHEIVNKLANAGGEVNVVNENDGVPNGLILLKCGVLRSVSEVGFHDMKEQVVPALSGKRIVKVVGGHGSASPPIHSLKDYTASLRRFHSGNAKGALIDERWLSRFSIQEQGSVVAASAVMHDSVVLEGGVVDRDAVLVRSVVGRGARVRPGEVVVGQVVH